MPTYPVTGTLADLGLDPIGDLDAVVIASPNGVIPLSSGEIVTEPEEAAVAADGTFTLDLASTSDALTKGARWRLTVGLRNPDGYTETQGYYTKRFPTWHFTVPRGGGRLVDLIDAKVTDDVFAVITDTTDTALLDDLHKRGVTTVLGTDTTPAAFYRLEA